MLSSSGTRVKDLEILYENGEPIPEDLVLQYGCVAGLRKIWLTGKP